MPTTQVNVTVPALPEFARSVRMMAANLAVVCHMSADVRKLTMIAHYSTWTPPNDFSKCSVCSSVS